MADVLVRIGAGLVRGGALLWLLVLAPLDLSVILVRLLSAVTPWRLPAVALISGRVAAVALGMVLGRRLAARETGLGSVAVLWAAVDLATLALVLATDVVPTSRSPGWAPVVWATAAGLAALVVLAAWLSAARPASSGAARLDGSSFPR
ncbi:MAG: hypothetical protein ACR2LU_13405 [Luteitalea sp.]